MTIELSMKKVEEKKVAKVDFRIEEKWRDSLSGSVVKID